MSNFDIFFETYTANLTKAVEKHPNQYGFPVNYVPTVVSKMKDAVKKGTFNKDGFGFKWTCKDLGIPYTYKAIKDFVNS